nr:putative holin [Pseudodesulfovibrio sp. JC047]
MPRMSLTTVLAVALVAAVALISPQQLGVIVYKVALVVLAGVAGYGLDRALFPYARPHKFDIQELLFEETVNKVRADEIQISSIFDWVPFVAAQLRRAAIVCAAMLAVGLGL